VLDKVDVKRVVLIRGNQFFHEAVGLFVIEFLWDQTDPFCYPKNMSVHRKYFPITCEQQNTGCRLGTDTREGCKKYSAILDWGCLQKGQIKFSPSCFDLVERFFDRHGFGVG